MIILGKSILLRNCICNIKYYTHFSIKMNDIFRKCAKGLNAGKRISDYQLSPGSNFMTKTGRFSWVFSLKNFYI